MVLTHAAPIQSSLGTHSKVTLEIGFYGRMKIGVLREKPSTQGREPTCHKRKPRSWHQLQESNPSNIGEREVVNHHNTIPAPQKL